MAASRPHPSHRGALLPAAITIMVVMAGMAAAAAVAPAALEEGGAGARGAVYVLSILSKNANQKVDPSSANKSAIFVFQVQNTGDSATPDSVLTLTNWNFPPGKWSYIFIPTPISVPPGETKQVMLVIYPAPDAEAKRYSFAVRGASNVPANSINITLDILQYGDVLLIAPASQAGDPGDTLEFGFEIKNAGNGKDKFCIVSIECGIPTVQPRLKDGNNWTIDLAPGKSVIKTVVVELPWDIRTTEGTGGIQLTISVRSAFNNSQEDAAWTYIIVAHRFDLSLGVSPPNATLLPGELAEFTVTVLNLGNGPDSISLNFTSTFDLSKWTISLGHSLFNLSAGKLGATKLRITPPLDALMGSDYRLELTARSSGPPFPELPVERTEPINMAIRQLRRLEAAVTSQTAPSPIAPGEVVRFGFNFTNKGNGEDSVNITVVEKPQNWHASLDFSHNIRIQPYVTQEVSLTVQASVNRNESLFQTYHVKLRVVNSDRSSVLNFTFAIPVGPVYDWEFSVTEPARGLVNPYANPVHSFSLVFTNTGNTGDDVQLALGGEYASWGKLDTQALSLAYGEGKQVRLAVEVPRAAEVGRDYGLRITATSQNSPSLVKEFSVSVAIIHLDMSVVPAGSLEINSNPWKDYMTKQGTRLNITVTLRNDGTDSVRGVNVRFYDNDIVFAEKNTSTIAPLRTAIFTVQWEALPPGTHVLTARADPGNQLPETNESNNEARAVVSVLSDGIDGPPPPGGPWMIALGALCTLIAAAGGAYVLVRRRPSYDRELYESIYGPLGRR